MTCCILLLQERARPPMNDVRVIACPEQCKHVVCYVSIHHIVSMSVCIVNTRLIHCFICLGFSFYFYILPRHGVVTWVCRLAVAFCPRVCFMTCIRYRNVNDFIL